MTGKKVNAKDWEASVVDRASWYSQCEYIVHHDRHGAKRASALFVSIKKSPQLPFSVVAHDVFKMERGAKARRRRDSHVPSSRGSNAARCLQHSSNGVKNKVSPERAES